jgi:hypothetical protein
MGKRDRFGGIIQETEPTIVVKRDRFGGIVVDDLINKYSIKKENKLDELKEIVKRMVAAGESEANIAAVIKRYNETNVVKKEQSTNVCINGTSSTSQSKQELLPLIRKLPQLNLKLVSPFLVFNSTNFYCTPKEAFIQYNFSKYFLQYNYLLGFTNLSIKEDSLWVTNFNNYPKQNEFDALLTNNCKALLQWYHNSKEIQVKNVKEYNAKLKTTTIQEQQVIQNIINSQEKAFKETPSTIESVILYEIPKQNSNATTFDLGLKIMETLQPLKYNAIKKYEKELNFISDKDKDAINDLGNLARTYYNAINAISDTTTASFQINYDSIIKSYKQKITTPIDSLVAKNISSGYYQFTIPIDNKSIEKGNNTVYSVFGIVLVVIISYLLLKRKLNKSKTKV